MMNVWGRSRLSRGLAPLMVVLTMLSILALPSPGSAGSVHVLLPPNHPSSNFVLVSRNMLTNLNVARSRIEGLAPMQANWAAFYRLPVDEQLFALANIDRVTRGLSPAVAMTTLLNADSQRAAQRQTDPMPTHKARLVYLDYSSNWSQAPQMQQSSMFAQLGWMYDDGPAPYVFGRNLDCPTARASGCWGHRDDILVPDVAMDISSDPNCLSTLYMGAASARMPYGLSVTEALAHTMCPMSSGIVVTWPSIAATLHLAPTETGFLAPSETFHPAGGIPLAVASDSSHVWALSEQPGGAGLVSEWSTTTGALLRRVAVEGSPTEIADDGTNLWVLVTATNSVVEVSGTTGHVLVTTPVGQNPVAISSAGGLVWVTNSTDGTVTEIDALSGSVLATITLSNPGDPLATPSAITSDASHAWVALGGADIAELDRSGTVVANYQVPDTPTLLASDGTELWASDAYHRLTGVNELTGTSDVSTTTPASLTALTVCGGRLITAFGSVLVYPVKSATTSETLGAPTPHRSLASWFGPATCAGSSVWLADRFNQSVDRVPISAF